MLYCIIVYIYCSIVISVFLISRVKIRSIPLNPKNCNKAFFALTVLMGRGESQKKSRVI